MTACDFERSEESLFRLEPINNFGCLVQAEGPTRQAWARCTFCFRSLARGCSEGNWPYCNV
jgi:hypothetical protein